MSNKQIYKIRESFESKADTTREQLYIFTNRQTTTYKQITLKLQTNNTIKLQNIVRTYDLCADCQKHAVPKRPP